MSLAYAQNYQKQQQYQNAASKANEQGKKYQDRLITHYGGNVGSKKETPTLTNNTTNSNNIISSANNTPGNNGLNSTNTASGNLATYLDNYINRLNQQAKSSYDNNKASIASMYQNARSSAESAYNSGMAALQQAYAQQQAKAKAEKEAADRESYINKMLQQKNLEQNLAAHGISGGASESTQAKLTNNYMNSRNAIYQNYSDNMTDLDVEHQTNVASAQSQYQNVLQALEQMRAQYDMQNEAQYQGNLANYTENYANIGANYETQLDLQKEINALNAYEFDRQLKANNDYRLAQLKQYSGNSATNVNNNTTGTGNTGASVEELIAQAKANGATTNSAIATYLKNAGLSTSQISAALGIG